MIKIITSEFKKDNLSVTLSFNLIDDVNPSVTLDSTQVFLTIPSGLTDNQMRSFVGTESLKKVQSFYNEWKIKESQHIKNEANKVALETYLNTNLVL